MKYMYKIIDEQGDNGVSFTHEYFKTTKQIIKRLANYHSIDYTGVKDNDEPYNDIYEFLNTLKNDKERLEWLLDYGTWRIKRVIRRGH